MTNIKFDVKSAPPYLFTGAAITCFILTAYFALHESVPTATLYSGLFVVCVIFGYFPQLDSIKAFSVDVKLKKNISRAEEIIANIRSLSIANARFAYTIAAYSGRGPSITIIEKQALIKIINKHLNNMNITDSERREVSSQYVKMIGYELYSIFAKATRIAVEAYSQNGDDKRYDHCRQWTARWHSLSYIDHSGRIRYEVIAPNLDNDKGLYKYMVGCIDELMRNCVEDQNIAAIDELAKYICDTYRECIEECGYTEKATKFITKYGSNDIHPTEMINLIEKRPHQV